jgi:hypothetical protein
MAHLAHAFDSQDIEVVCQMTFLEMALQKISNVAREVFDTFHQQER